MQFQCPSRTYAAIPYCIIYLILTLCVCRYLNPRRPEQMWLLYYVRHVRDENTHIPQAVHIWGERASQGFFSRHFFNGVKIGGSFFPDTWLISSAILGIIAWYPKCIITTHSWLFFHVWLGKSWFFGSLFNYVALSHSWKSFWST